MPLQAELVRAHRLLHARRVHLLQRSAVPPPVRDKQHSPRGSQRGFRPVASRLARLPRRYGDESTCVCLATFCLFTPLPGAAWAGAERDVVLVDGEHSQRGRAGRSGRHLYSTPQDIHKVPYAGQPLSLCLRRAAVWRGSFWMDAASGLAPDFVSNCTEIGC